MVSSAGIRLLSLALSVPGLLQFAPEVLANSDPEIQQVRYQHPQEHIQPPDQSLFEDYRQWLQSEIEARNVPGAAMIVVTPHSFVDLRTWGVRNVQDGTPLTPDTVFRIASVSKTFAGTVGAQLVAHNLLDWDEPLINLLPDYRLGDKPEYGSQISLRHVLSHSTGLMPHAYSNLLDAGQDYRKIQTMLHEIPAVCAPGRCYGYQNVVFSLVADVIENSLGTDYDSFVEENIFAPLGMTGASMGLDGYKDNPAASSPHQAVRAKQWRVSTLNPAYYSVGPASGVNATILDMGRWAQAHLGGYPDVLPPEMLEVLHAPVVETPSGSYFNRWPRVQKAWYGLGWRVMDYAGKRIIHHGGGVRGYRSEMVLVPELNIGLVVLFNAETPLANEVVPRFLDHVLSLEAL
ncbi:MAG TPA: serine hydrolase domain-containing protein [Pseudohongiella sp.]|nr:serine hydrolase domain-containing protein [Pseudohongiella sp.]